MHITKQLIKMGACNYIILLDQHTTISNFSKFWFNSSRLCSMAGETSDALISLNCGNLLLDSRGFAEACSLVIVDMDRIEDDFPLSERALLVINPDVTREPKPAVRREDARNINEIDKNNSKYIESFRCYQENISSSKF
jgi:hypothetical protein